MPLTREQAIEIVQGAFRPLLCVAEGFDANERLRFVVVSSDGKRVLEAPNLTRHEFENADEFATVIDVGRQNITEQGIQLDAWTFPAEA